MDLADEIEEDPLAVDQLLIAQRIRALANGTMIVEMDQR